MTSQVQFPTTMDFPLQADMADADSLNEPLTTSKKKIPKELTAHGTTPSGKPRLFVCNTCTRAFARLEHLRRHERSHTKEKPFTCGVCQRKFSRRDLLLRHAQKLHAGCSDAITRLRRKLMKSNSVSSDYDDMDGMPFQGDYPADYKDFKSDSPPASSSYRNTFPTPSTSHRGSMDLVLFNLNLFSNRKDQPKAPISPARMSRSNSIKDASLQKQLFDRRKSYRNRGASFSAQSGANYAGVPEYSDAMPAENVEFSTPQLLPTTTGDEPSWFSNLSTIPGMTEGFGGPSKTDLDPEVPHATMFSLLGLNLLRSDSVASGSSVNTMESSVAHPPAMIRNGSLSKPSAGSNGTKPEKSEVRELGYSFYDIPESFTMNGTPIPKMRQPLSPIKQELEDELMDLENVTQFDNPDSNGLLIPAAITNGVNFDLNFLNDIDELTQDFDVGSRFLPNGYSFYGDNPLVSSSGIESTTPQNMSPAAIHQGSFYPNKGLQFTSQQGNANFTSDPGLQDLDVQMAKKRQESPYSRTKLFTKNMRHMINKSLSKYPISGIMTPTIPSNEKMEFFLSSFVTSFLSHFPFIHSSKLNEHEIMNMTANEDSNNESARVCMPLLVATIGALMANNKNDSEHLYEASRRTIHIYLESRKNSVNDTNSNASSSQSINPLWLIQSLTLSVIYGLFSDNENNVYIVIRQLNALNSLVKTSIKSNRAVLFSFNGQDDANFKSDNANDTLEGLDLKFKNNINMQSQVRIVFMIYRLTNFILMMYNVPLTLSLNDMGSLACPNTNDEFLWHFNDLKHVTKYLRSVGSPNDLNYYLKEDSSNKIVFKDLLMSLLKNEIDMSIMDRLSKLSKFGFSTIAHGLFEIKQYEEMKHIEVFTILDNLTLFIDNSKNNASTRFPTKTDFEKLDYALLVNFIKICSIIDFKLVKEQSWLRNFDELTRNFHKFLISMESIDDFDYLKVIDCCIVITKLILFRTDDTESRQQGGNMEIFLSEFSYLGNRSPSNFKLMVNDSLQHQYNTSANFEKMIKWTVFDEIDSSKTSIHSQMLFHVFVIFSIFAVYIAKRNNPDTLLGMNSNQANTKQLNQRFIIVLRLLAKIENFLKSKYQNSKLESEFTNLYLFLSGTSNELLMDENLDPLKSDSAMRNILENHHYFAYSLEKSLYVLKIGELMLRYLYDTSIKICIFKKLSGSLSQIRKFMIEDEARLLS